jgi:hypothetical protein
MIRTKTKTIAFLLSPAVLLLAFSLIPAGAKSPAGRGWDTSSSHCVPVGGSVVTNFGAFASDPNTTLGTATGDLRGAVSGSLLSAPQTSNGHVNFQIQHHWVTETGDTLTFDPATLTAQSLSQTLFAILTYPAHLKGGTGRFAGASGDLNFIGEVDVNAGTALRYTGTVCFADPDNH